MEDELKQKRFLWGVALAWAPSVPMMISLGYVVSGHRWDEGDWARGSGWRICGGVCAHGPCRDADLRGRRAMVATVSRILARAWSAKCFFGALHLYEWVDDSSLWLIAVAVLVPESPRILNMKKGKALRRLWTNIWRVCRSRRGLYFETYSGGDSVGRAEGDDRGHQLRDADVSSTTGCWWRYAAFKNHCSLFPTGSGVLDRFEKELEGIPDFEGDDSVSC